MSSISEVQLTRISLSVPHGGCEHITHAGNSSGMWSREQIISWIEGEQYRFFTQVNYHKTYVGVVQGVYGKYIRTYANGVWNDNLLSLARAA